ncbi:MAG TPA: hypothetical protein VID94_04810, partial [Acidimicrobiales bacterium]
MRLVQKVDRQRRIELAGSGDERIALSCAENAGAAVELGQGSPHGAQVDVESRSVAGWPRRPPDRVGQQFEARGPIGGSQGDQDPCGPAPDGSQ